MRIVNVFVCRSAVRSLRETGLSGHRLIGWGVALEFGLLIMIVYTPWGNTLFGTASPPMAMWLCILPFVLAMILGEEARKWYVRRRLRAGLLAVPAAA